MNAKSFLEEAEGLTPTLTAHRRFLHSHAETAFDLKDTIAYVKQQLTELGLDAKLCGKAGVTADIVGKKPGRLFLLRADMDALPIEEETGLPYSGKAGRMHACGHDLHTAMLLGAAQLLLSHTDELCGTIRLMFQPAEEVFLGAADMIENGILENVDRAMMLHVLTGISVPTGTVIVPAPGAGTPAADYFTLHIQGQGCHGSMPHTGSDPLIPASHILLGFQQIQTREVSPDEPVTLTVGTFHAGQAPNAIAQDAVMEGTLRTRSEETRTQIKHRMEQLSTSVASAFRTQAALTFGPGCPTLLNDEVLCEQAYHTLLDLLGAEKTWSVSRMKIKPKSGGSEDFAYVSQKVPSLMIALSAGQTEKGHHYPAHHPKTTFDEDVLPIGAAVYAWTALTM